MGSKSEISCCCESSETGLEEEPLYDPRLLSQIDWESRKSGFKNRISPTNPGDSLCLRPLCIADFDRGYLNVLRQLTIVGDVTKESFIESFKHMKQSQGNYYVTVLEDTRTNEIIGNATLLVEQKFIHSCGLRGRVEDVVVLPDYRGKQLGKLLVETMTLLGKLVGCYKMTLECKDDKIPFYENHGYKKDVGNNFMVQRYKD